MKEKGETFPNGQGMVRKARRVSASVPYNWPSPFRWGQGVKGKRRGALGVSVKEEQMVKAGFYQACLVLKTMVCLSKL